MVFKNRWRNPAIARSGAGRNLESTGAASPSCPIFQASARPIMTRKSAAPSAGWNMKPTEVPSPRPYWKGVAFAIRDNLSCPAIGWHRDYLAHCSRWRITLHLLAESHCNSIECADCTARRRRFRRSLWRGPPRPHRGKPGPIPSPSAPRRRPRAPLSRNRRCFQLMTKPHQRYHALYPALHALD